MLSIKNVEVLGWDHAVRGMRNPLNSWAKSDSTYSKNENSGDCRFNLGTKDLDLMRRLRNAGIPDRKFMRMIVVYADIIAPLYWWKEFDTYKVGTVANSCSTMHKIAAKEFTLDDFSYEHLSDVPNCDPAYLGALERVIFSLNEARHCYLDTEDKRYWWQMIQLLPSSYNQKRTVMLNYEVLANQYHSRRHHKLDEWQTYCDFIETLPYSDLITCADNHS